VRAEWCGWKGGLDSHKRDGKRSSEEPTLACRGSWRHLVLPRCITAGRSTRSIWSATVDPCPVIGLCVVGATQQKTISQSAGLMRPSRRSLASWDLPPSSIFLFSSSSRCSSSSACRPHPHHLAAPGANRPRPRPCSRAELEGTDRVGMYPIAHTNRYLPTAHMASRSNHPEDFPLPAGRPEEPSQPVSQSPWRGAAHHDLDQGKRWNPIFDGPPPDPTAWTLGHWTSCCPITGGRCCL